MLDKEELAKERQRKLDVISNLYSKDDMVRRESAIITSPMKIAAYRVRDPETLEWSGLQFHMTYDNTVMEVMCEGSAKLFAQFVQQTMEVRPEPSWPGPRGKEKVIGE